MRRRIRVSDLLRAIALVSFATASVADASTDDPFSWRQYLTSAEWDHFSVTLDRFTTVAGALAAQKDACAVKDDAREHFIEALTRTHLIRTGVEIEDQKKKYDAWRMLMKPLRCDFPKIETSMSAQTRILTDMLDIEKTGLSREMSGETTRR